MNDNRSTATRVHLRNVRLAYADTLLTPKAFEDGQPPKYGCTLLFPPGYPGDQVEAALEAAATARWGSKADWPRPLRGITKDPAIKDVADYPRIGIKEPGWCFVRCNSLDPPGIVNADLSEVGKADLRREVYSGRWVTVSLNAFAYDRQTGAGVALGLGNIQLLKHDTRLGAPRPTPGEEFDPEDLPQPDNDDEDDLEPRRSTRRR